MIAQYIFISFMKNITMSFLKADMNNGKRVSLAQTPRQVIGATNTLAAIIPLLHAAVIPPPGKKRKGFFTESAASIKHVLQLTKRFMGNGVIFVYLR